MLKIYFSGSIRGGREDLNVYKKIIKHLQQFGEVLTEHIGSDKITEFGETENSEEKIYERDLKWLKSCDVKKAIDEFLK